MTPLLLEFMRMLLFSAAQPTIIQYNVIILYFNDIKNENNNSFLKVALELLDFLFKVYKTYRFSIKNNAMNHLVNSWAKAPLLLPPAFVSDSTLFHNRKTLLRIVSWFNVFSVSNY